MNQKPGTLMGHGVGLPDAALAPGWVVGGALDHGAAGGVWHLVGEDAARAVDGGDDVFFGRCS